MSKKLFIVFVSALLLVLACASAANAAGAPTKLAIYYNQKGKGATTLTDKEIFRAKKSWGTLTLQILPNPINASDEVTWSSSNSKIASFADKNKGTIRFNRVGKAKICAKSKVSGKITTCFNLSVEPDTQPKKKKTNPIDVHFKNRLESFWREYKKGHPIILHNGSKGKKGDTNALVRATKYGISIPGVRNEDLHIFCEPGARVKCPKNKKGPCYKPYCTNKKCTKKIWANTDVKKFVTKTTGRTAWQVWVNKNYRGTFLCTVYIKGTGNYQSFYIKR